MEVRGVITLKYAVWTCGHSKCYSTPDLAELVFNSPSRRPYTQPSEEGKLCWASGRRCIGETCKTRVNEHQRKTANGEIYKFKISEHSLEQKHGFQWDKASKVENSRIRKLKESAFIHFIDNVISQPSIDISPTWLPITLVCMISDDWKLMWFWLVFSCWFQKWF